MTIKPTISRLRKVDKIIAATPELYAALSDPDHEVTNREGAIERFAPELLDTILYLSKKGLDPMKCGVQSVRDACDAVIKASRELVGNPEKRVSIFDTMRVLLSAAIVLDVKNKELHKLYMEIYDTKEISGTHEIAVGTLLSSAKHVLCFSKHPKAPVWVETLASLSSKYINDAA